MLYVKEILGDKLINFIEKDWKLILIIFSVLTISSEYWDVIAAKFRKYVFWKISYGACTSYFCWPYSGLFQGLSGYYWKAQISIINDDDDNDDGHGMFLWYDWPSKRI